MSAPLLQLLATDAERSGRECGKPLDRNGGAALLTPAVVALLEALEGALDLVDPLEDVVGEGDLLLALEGLGARVGLVVAGGIGQPVALGLGDLVDGLVVLF